MVTLRVLGLWVSLLHQYCYVRHISTRVGYWIIDRDELLSRVSRNALQGLFQRVLQRKHTFHLQSLGRNIFVHITTENWLERKVFRSKTQNSG